MNSDQLSSNETDEEERKAGAARLSSLPMIDIFANESGGITIRTTEAKTRKESSVDIPLVFVPGIIVLLQSSLDQINKDNRSAADHEGE